MTVVDSTIWVDYFRGISTPQVDWLDSHIPLERLGLTDLILCEVLQGVRDDKDFRIVRTELLKFEVFFSGGLSLATGAAENFRRLRAEGITVRKTIDCLIATFCLRNGFSLLHHDRDFDPFEQILGLQVIHP